MPQHKSTMQAEPAHASSEPQTSSGPDASADVGGIPRSTGQRPVRATLRAEDGRRLTLASGQEAFVQLGDEVQKDGSTATAALVLGLGAETGAALDAGPLAGCRDVLWLESPDFVAGMEEQQPGWAGAIPAHWQRLDSGQRAAPLSAGEALCARAAACAARGRRVLWHTQNLRLFPSFWGPVLGAVQAALLGLATTTPSSARAVPTAAPACAGSVFLPGGAQDLLHQELAQAFAAEGYTVLCPAPLSSPARQGETRAPAEGTLIQEHGLHDLLRAHLREDRPALFFSVNGRGLDAQGVDFSLLRACGVPVALWLVDNPWHILSAWRQPWWREAHIFVTDHSFIPALRAAGAASVHHMPLAAAPHMAAARNAQPVTPAAGYEKSARIHFVGRASFPARDTFFAAAHVPPALLHAALERVDADPLPDFHWWAQALAVPLWPGHAVRAAGLGAERCSALRRARWLEAALPLGLAVHGDEEGWRNLLPHAPASTFHPAVDYYGALPRLYARAPYSLNVTSLLLPAGLTQRHFDVWAAGGFLLGDATPGLHIFPSELVRETALEGPRSLSAALHRLEGDAGLRLHIQEAWQAHVDARHTYAHRVRQVLEVLHA